MAIGIEKQLAREIFQIDKLLKEFIALVNSDSISFLMKSVNRKQRVAVLAAANKLLERVQKAKAKKQSKKKGTTAGKQPSEEMSLESYEVHEEAGVLWRKLISAALWHIDPGAKGNSALYKYLEDATRFEDILYGLDDFYRDHTLHSLWVYLIGLNLMKEEDKLKRVADDLNWYVFNDVTEDEHDKVFVDWAKLTKRFLDHKINEKRHAIWCIMALCHDLGYSIAKLSGLNESVQKVLEHYDVSNLGRVGYSLDIEHQYLVEQFLELMAMDVRIVPRAGDPEEFDKSKWPKNTKEYKNKEQALSWIEDWIKRDKVDFESDDSPYKQIRKCIGPKRPSQKSRSTRDFARLLNANILIKCYRDDSSYWRLCKALEKKEHGILSAYLLFKTMGIFADTYIRGSAEEWGLEEAEAISNVVCGDILFGIAQHEFGFAHVSSMGSLAEILILCDELEEFSRYGRELQSRKYRHTTANTKVRILYSGPAADRWITIKSKYLSTRGTDRNDFCAFCCHKAGVMCQRFSLESNKNREKEKEQDKSKHPVRKIEASFVKRREGKFKSITVVFSIVSEPSLGQEMTVAVGRIKRKFHVECRDDKLYDSRSDKELDPKRLENVVGEMERSVKEKRKA